jgi:hypothetical protein
MADGALHIDTTPYTRHEVIAHVVALVDAAEYNDGPGTGVVEQGAS